MIAAREFTSAEEMRAHYAAVRRRINAAAISQAPEPELAPVPAPDSDVIELPRLSTARRVIRINERSKSPARDFVARFARWHGRTLNDLAGAGRRDAVVHLRHDAILALMLFRPDMSLNQIGKVFGGRDHTTILHAARKAYARSVYRVLINADLSRMHPLALLQVCQDTNGSGFKRLPVHRSGLLSLIRDQHKGLAGCGQNAEGGR